MKDMRQNHQPRARQEGRPSGRRAKGRYGLWTALRRLLWTWWLWSFVSIWAATSGRCGWAIAMAAIALITYLVTPSEQPPEYGLDHDFSVDSQEFLNSVVASTGIPFLEGNRVQLLNNGDEFYPAMLAAIQTAQSSITMEAFIYWQGEIGERFAQALSEKARSVTVKIRRTRCDAAANGFQPELA